MVDPRDRRYIYCLRKEECVRLLEKLGKDQAGSVQTLRVRLSNIAKKASELEIKIFEDFKKEYEQRKDVEIFKKYVQQLPFADCHEVLIDFKGECEEPEEEQRKALVEVLNQTSGDEREGWLEIAEDFCSRVGDENKTDGSFTSEVINDNEHNDSSSVSSADSVADSRHDENIRNCHSTYKSFRPDRSRLPEMAILMDQVRKWNIRFSGGSPTAALSFIEKLETMACSYEMCVDQLPKAMPELLRDSASEWYHNNREDCASWEDFKDSFYLFYVPRKLQLEIEDEIRTYKQKPHQTVRDYIIGIQSLMRRIPGYSEIEKLNRYYSNLSSDYQLGIKRREFSSLRELILLGEEFESKMKLKSIEDRRSSKIVQGFSRPNTHKNAAINADYTVVNNNPIEKEINPFRKNPTVKKQQNTGNTPKINYVCYNCNQEGHMSRYCRKPKKICRICNKRGVTTEECSCRQERQASQSFCAKCRRLGFTTEKCPCSVQSTSTQERVSTCSTKISQISSVDNRPRREVFIMEKAFTALLDSGATTSYVNKKVTQWLEETGHDCIPVNIRTFLANRAMESTKRSYEVQMSMGDKIISSKFLVMENMLEDITLGMDCLDMLNFKLIESDTDPIIPKCSNIVHREMLSSDEELVLQHLLTNELSKCTDLTGGTSLIEHRICMKNDLPIRQRYFPKNPKMREIISK